MTITATLPHIVHATDAVTLKLNSSKGNETGTMRVLVGATADDLEPVEFRLSKTQPAATNQQVPVPGKQTSITVQSGWGSQANVGGTFVVEIDGVKSASCQIR